jgi:hypothetical protein
VAFFDHSHNLLLQLAVESGLPLTVAVAGGTGWALWRARSGLVAESDETARGARTALFMLVMVGVHSLLEYPLWYTYFLMPAAIVAGWFTGSVPAEPGSGGAGAARSFWPVVWVVTGALGFGGALWSTVEYARVAVIFEPELAHGEPEPLAVRIERGRRSVLWGHHADYALVTMAPEPQTVFDAFERPLYHLADTRLLVAYARALAARGELDRATHVAARLREFRNPLSNEFFSSCEGPGSDRLATPFQCLPDPGLPAEALRPHP